MDNQPDSSYRKEDFKDRRRSNIIGDLVRFYGGCRDERSDQPLLRYRITFNYFFTHYGLLSVSVMFLGIYPSLRAYLR